MAGPRVRVLWWSGCPSHTKARSMVEEIMADIGLDPATIESCQIVTREEAERERFIGSPTIEVDGVDIAPRDEDSMPALTCRLYFTREGRPSALPDRADVRDALTAHRSDADRER